MRQNIDKQQKRDFERRALRVAFDHYLDIEVAQEDMNRFRLLSELLRNLTVRLCQGRADIFLATFEMIGNKENSEPVTEVRRLIVRCRFNLSCTADEVAKFIVACVRIFCPTPPRRRIRSMRFRRSISNGLVRAV